MKKIFFLFFAFCVHQADAMAIGGGGETKKDTASAVVMYGDTLMVAASLLTDDELYRKNLDSLLSAESFDAEQAAHLALIKSVPRRTPAEVSVMIDSLFSLDEVPYPLINEINLYITLLENRKARETIFATEEPHPSPNPAACFYNDWNEEVPNPYKYAADELDSVVYLKLRDSLQFCDFQHPHFGPVTSRFGWRYGRRHSGIDVDLEVWDPVHAAFAGQVRVARYYGGYGRVVVIRHYNGLETLYAHLHRFKVKSGDYVEAGEVIGLGGSSGRSSGSHLHFEVRFKGVPVNPEHLIDFKCGKLLGDTLVIHKSEGLYNGRTTNTTIHRVEKGEYLHKIADRYGVSIQQICELNGIRRNSVLRVGQRLRING